MHNFARVLLADQKDVLAYLTGKQETSQYLASVEELTTLAVPQTQETSGRSSSHVIRTFLLSARTTLQTFTHKVAT
jgi:hypothetical protein